MNDEPGPDDDAADQGPKIDYESYFEPGDDDEADQGPPPPPGMIDIATDLLAEEEAEERAEPAASPSTGTTTPRRTE